VRRDLAALGAREWDVAVVGGGIYGAAVAWDAAQRGLSVALLEREDFGAGVSWNSLKTIHGGMRYLQKLDFGRLRESARERTGSINLGLALDDMATAIRVYQRATAMGIGRVLPL